jgi:hypothetical protein
MDVVEWDGKPVSKPGWYRNIPIERYHSAGMCDGPAVSSTDLRTCWSHSPAKMFAFWAENPKREERTVSNAMLLGGCAHFLLLGEADFRKKYAAQPEEYPDKKTGEMKKWHMGADHCKDWVAFHQAKGFTIVTVKMLDAIVRMAESLRIVTLVKEGLLRGHVETSGFFRDQETGIWLKVRPDVVPSDGPDFVDLKTAAEVTTVALQSSIYSYGYNQQAALIAEVCEGFGQPFESFMCLFVETAAPYCARMTPLTDVDLGLGREQNRDCLRRISASIKAGHWPGPGEDNPLQPLGMGKDKRERIMARLTQEGLG